MNQVYPYILCFFLLVGCKQENSMQRQSELGNGAHSAAAVLGDTPKKLLTYEQRQGRYLFMKYCAVCHGEGGKGDGFNAFNLNPKPRDFTDAKYMNALSGEQLMETISQGGKGVNKSALMPAWGNRMTKNEREYLITFLRRLAAK